MLGSNQIKLLEKACMDATGTYEQQAKEEMKHARGWRCWCGDDGMQPRLRHTTEVMR